MMMGLNIKTIKSGTSFFNQTIASPIAPIHLSVCFIIIKARYIKPILVMFQSFIQNLNIHDGSKHIDALTHSHTLKHTNQVETWFNLVKGSPKKNAKENKRT